jgi:hypothetical protein
MTCHNFRVAFNKMVDTHLEKTVFGDHVSFSEHSGFRLSYHSTSGTPSHKKCFSQWTQHREQYMSCYLTETFIVIALPYKETYTSFIPMPPMQWTRQGPRKAGGPQINRKLIFFSDWIPFFRQKAVFWIPLMGSGIDLANNYRELPLVQSREAPDLLPTPVHRC